MNEIFTNIFATIGEPVTETTLNLDDEEVISLSYDQYKNHQSVKIIVEKH